MPADVWRRAAGCELGNCVEVAFVKAARSMDNGTCVEVAACHHEVKVRDSKDRAGPVLTFTPAEWAVFCDGVRGGEFDVA